MTRSTNKRVHANLRCDRFRRVAIAILMSFAAASMAEAASLGEILSKTHVHGIAIAGGDRPRVLLAMHHGLFEIDSPGEGRRVSADTNDYMGFTPHPTESGVLLASGHPPGGGNLGVVVSRDGGQTWAQLSPGVRGPVDFHQMDISRANPEVVHGAHGALQVSRDGGRSWKVVARLPEGLIDLAASAVDEDRLFAATRAGLLYSVDGGRTWRPAHLRKTPATMVQTGHEGEIYAFVGGAGLLRAEEPSLGWTVVSDTFGDRYVLHLAVDPGDSRHFYVVTTAGEVLESRDGGASWAASGSGETGSARAPSRG